MLIDVSKPISYGLNFLFIIVLFCPVFYTLGRALSIVNNQDKLALIDVLKVEEFKKYLKILEKRTGQKISIKDTYFIFQNRSIVIPTKIVVLLNAALTPDEITTDFIVLKILKKVHDKKTAQTLFYLLK